MIPVAKLKQNLEFNKSLGNIIDALKLVASIQLRQFQTKRPLYRDFLEALKECADMLELEKRAHPLLAFRQNLPRCIVGVTSDEGFLGELNTLVINAMLDNRKDSQRDVIAVLGERGAGYLEDINVSFIVFPGITDELPAQEEQDLKGYLIKEYLEGKFSEVLIVYPKFVSVTVQHIETVRLLPCSLKPAPLSSSVYGQALIEPGPADVVEGLVKLWMGYVLADVFWSSKLSELAARLMHLDGSKQELNQVNQRLNLEYFRYLHMLADKTIREISACRFLRRG